jgi:hypothetical protein
MLDRANIPTTLPPDLTEVLVTTFNELRSGKTGDGKSLETLTTALSTAEAVSVAYAAGIHAYFYGDGQVTAAHLVQSLLGSALKDSPEDVKKLRHYFDNVVKHRRGDHWKAFHEAGKHIE